MDRLGRGVFARPAGERRRSRPVERFDPSVTPAPTSARLGRAYQARVPDGCSHDSVERGDVLVTDVASIWSPPNAMTPVALDGAPYHALREPRQRGQQQEARPHKPAGSRQEEEARSDYDG